MALVADAQEVMAGRRRGWRAVLPFTGPAVVVSVAYMDPGNFATNLQAGASYHFSLIWVVVLASIIAMLFQVMSANLGIVSGRNLAEVCRAEFKRPVSIAMWVVSEIAAMATDVAECLGAAIAIALIAHVSLLVGMSVTAAVTGVILATQRHGFRPMEAIIGAFVTLIGACYIFELGFVRPAWPAVAAGFVPTLPDGGALTLAVGVVGATVMPHAIYLHSSLTQRRVPARSENERRLIVRFSTREVVIALSVAGAINLAMMIVAGRELPQIGAHAISLESAYKTLEPLLGSMAATLFLLSLLAAGLSSSVVGTLAGQVVMQGFIGFAIPVWVRRIVTIVPAFLVIAAGVNSTQALIFTQIILSVILPVPMIALIVLSRRRSVMGAYVAGTRLSLAAASAALAIIVMNVMLIWRSA